MPAKKIEKKQTKKEKDPNQPKKNKSAYMFYCVDGRNEIKKENPDMDNKAVLVELGVRWNKIKESDPDRLKHYNDLAEQDKKRYADEKGSYVKDDVEEEVEEVVKEKKTKKKAVAKKSDDDEAEKPKKTKVNGYINFCTVNREKYKVDNPTLLPKDVTRKLGEGWKALSDEEKEKYKY
jgi:hypothetical protein